MNEILCSTGALIGRPNGRNYRLLESLAGQLSCDGFEFMMYDTWYGEEEELVCFLLSQNLRIPVMHCEKAIGEYVSKGEFEEAYRCFEINCRIAQRLRAKKLVMHLWDGLTSDANFENNITAYPGLAGLAAQCGAELLVENVVCSHANPLRRWCELAAKYPGIPFIFDTKMAAFHGQLELLYEKEYEWLWKNGHIRHYHVNDYGGGYMDWKNLRTLPIGKGNIDFERFFAHIKNTGYEGALTVESTAFGADGSVDVGMLNAQFAYIRAALQGE